MTPNKPNRPQAALWDAVARGAFDFFWRETDPKTGLTKDRARNYANERDANYNVASVASTGYALAALPVGVTRGWVTKKEAEARAQTTLRFLATKLPHEHGFFYHFVDWRDGKRVWNCELSSIDTSLLVLGALTAGQFFGGQIQRDANALYARLDWPWMQNRTASDPAGVAPSMGWKPENGFIPARWAGYTEALYLYLLALGAPRPLPRAAWDALTFPEATVEGQKVFGGPAPLFFAQMTPAYFDLRNRRDSHGRDWWTNFTNAHQADVAFSKRSAARFATFREGLWGVTACDQPGGYGAHEPRDGSSDGTIAPTAMAAGALFIPDEAERGLTILREKFGDKAWGRYGFCNALNVGKNWFDRDVIGIDLGMTLLCLENKRSGLIWRLTGSHPSLRGGLAAAGLDA